jgi:hypothetical protein
MFAFDRASGPGCAMQSRARLGLSLLPLLAALLAPACKTVDKDENLIDASLLPPAATIASAAPTTTATTPAPITPTPAATTPPTTTTKLDAGAPTDAGAATIDAGQVVDAGTATNAKVKACADKCQGVLQGCALPQIPTDGGLPTLKDPAACQAAAVACFAACKP